MSQNPLTDPTSYLAYRLANGKPLGRAGNHRSDPSPRPGGAPGRRSAGATATLAAVVFIALAAAVVAIALRIVFVGAG